MMTRVKDVLAESEAELAQEVEGFPRWSLKDFTGRYHLRNIAHRPPIPGSQVALEELRLWALEERRKREDHNHKKVVADFKRAIKEKGHLAFDLEKYRQENHGRLRYLIDDVEQVLKNRKDELAQIDLRHRREEKGLKEGNPDPKLFAFHQYVATNEQARVKVLLENDSVDVNDVGAFCGGRTALFQACVDLNAEMVDILLHHGADPNQKDVQNSGPAHIIFEVFSRQQGGFRRQEARAKMALIIKNMLEKGLDLCTPDRNGLTPLHHAAKHKVTEICKLMLSRRDCGILHLRDRRGKRPVDLIEDSSHECSRLLRNWETCMKATRLNKFRAFWQNKECKVGKTSDVGNLLDSLRDGDRSADATTKMRDGILQCKKEHSECIETFEKIGSLSKQESSVAVQNLIDNAKRALTPQALIKIQKERQKLKPSHQRLTILELLVGKHFREKVSQQAEDLREKPQIFTNLKARRKAAARAELIFLTKSKFQTPIPLNSNLKNSSTTVRLSSQRFAKRRIDSC